MNAYAVAFHRSRRSFWRHWRAYHYQAVRPWAMARPSLMDEHIDQLVYLARQMAREARLGGLLS